jgi:hypothetical protein
MKKRTKHLLLDILGYIGIIAGLIGIILAILKILGAF